MKGVWRPPFSSRNLRANCKVFTFENLKERPALLLNVPVSQGLQCIDEALLLARGFGKKQVRETVCGAVQKGTRTLAKTFVGSLLREA